MHVMLKPAETDDPHDAPAMAPDMVPATGWADKVLADIKRDAGDQTAIRPPRLDDRPITSDAAPLPEIDTTFRPAALERPKAPDSDLDFAFMFALALGTAAAAWQHYGETAKLMVAAWMPTFAASAPPPAGPAVSATQSDAAPVQAAATDQPAEPAAAPPQENAAPGVAALPPDTAQLIQSMGRDLAAMTQQVERLKAEVADLKASQNAAPRAESKPLEAKPAEPRVVEFKPAAIRSAIQGAKPKASPTPQRTAAAPAPIRRPPPAAAYYPPAQPSAAPMPLAPAPQPSAGTQFAADPLDGPVVRPPMPLR